MVRGQDVHRVHPAETEVRPESAHRGPQRRLVVTREAHRSPGAAGGDPQPAESSPFLVVRLREQLLRFRAPLPGPRGIGEKPRAAPGHRARARAHDGL